MNASSWLAQAGERLFGAEPRGIQGMEVVCPPGGPVLFRDLAGRC